MFWTILFCIFSPSGKVHPRHRVCCRPLSSGPTSTVGQDPVNLTSNVLSGPTQPGFILCAAMGRRKDAESMPRHFMSMPDTHEHRAWKEPKTTKANSDRQVNLLVAVCVSYTGLIWEWRAPEGWLLKCHVHSSSRPFVLFHFLLSDTSFFILYFFPPPHPHTNTHSLS